MLHRCSLYGVAVVTAGLSIMPLSFQEYLPKAEAASQTTETVNSTKAQISQVVNQGRQRPGSGHRQRVR